MFSMNLNLGQLVLILLLALVGCSSWHSTAESLQLPSPHVRALARPPARFEEVDSRAYNGSPRLLQNQRDLFECVDPNIGLFKVFATTFNRSFEDNIDQLERKELFISTLKRTILLNRLVQNEILNRSNYDHSKPALGDYHFITPLGSRNVALWFADITDCELGLIKYIVFNIIYHVENNHLAEAYKLALDNSAYLPLLNGDGFEQLANILLVRLFDRFQGDERMSQLFRWPHYLKRLAGYAYQRRQAEQPDYNERLALISFAYPAFFKDVRYNPLAVNRTSDSWRAHDDHEKFNKFYGRQFADLNERNKRLAIFRQRWTLVNQLNGAFKRDLQTDIEMRPEWLDRPSRLPAPYYGDAPTGSGSGGMSASLRAEEDSAAAQANSPQLSYPAGQFRHTQFSDLTDAEFVAYLTNDFSLPGAKEAADYLESNFPPRPLTESFREELAHELELRRALKPANAAQPVEQQQQQNFRLSRRVIDELISDVGLPIGAAAVDGIPEEEFHAMFNKVSAAFNKSYLPANVERAGNLGGGLTAADLSDERQRRYDQFKLNYARFRAWFIKEGWEANGALHDDTTRVAMLRLADMSWQDMKLLLFKICCLTSESLGPLEAQNATIRYLASNRFLCQTLSRDALREQMLKRDFAGVEENPKLYEQFTQQQQWERDERDAQRASDMAALELYYYYTAHFNKHHSDMDSFNKRFAIFRNNIEQVRRLSCTRALTTYASLDLRRPDTLSSIDTLDQRRAYTDDINLDRYRYFTVPNLALSPTQQQMSLDELNSEAAGASERLRLQQEQSEPAVGGHELPTRAGFSYRGPGGSLFSGLLDSSAKSVEAGPGQQTTYANKLVTAATNFNLQALKYRQNGAHRVYELVMQRYRYCMRTVNGKKVDSGVRQNCRDSGALSDLSIEPATRLEQLTSGERMEMKQQDQCAFYRMGLEAWDEGLIRQDKRSPKLVADASCQAKK